MAKRKAKLDIIEVRPAFMDSLSKLTVREVKSLLSMRKKIGPEAICTLLDTANVNELDVAVFVRLNRALIRKGLADSKAGRTVPLEKVAKKNSDRKPEK